MQLIIKSNQSDREFIFSEVDDEDVMFKIKSFNCEAKAQIYLYPVGGSLVEFFEDLSAQQRPWTYTKTWASIENELQFRAESSELGLVKLQAGIISAPWKKEPFELKASIFLDLGSLPVIANEARKFFPESRDIRLR